MVDLWDGFPTFVLAEGEGGLEVALALHVVDDNSPHCIPCGAVGREHDIIGAVVEDQGRLGAIVVGQGEVLVPDDVLYEVGKVI